MVFPILYLPTVKDLLLVTEFLGARTVDRGLVLPTFVARLAVACCFAAAVACAIEEGWFLPLVFRWTTFFVPFAAPSPLDLDEYLLFATP